jgi:hypothetical protein
MRDPADRPLTGDKEPGDGLMLRGILPIPVPTGA